MGTRHPSVPAERQFFCPKPVLVSVTGRASGLFPWAMGEDLEIMGEMFREAATALPIGPQCLIDAPARGFLGCLVAGDLLCDRPQPADFFTEPVECGAILSSQSLVPQCRGLPCADNLYDARNAETVHADSRIGPSPVSLR